MKIVPILRDATIDDMQDTFKLANDKTLRELSIDEREILWQDHILWYDNLLKDDNSIAYTITDESDNYIGYIRFNKDVDSWKVSIALDKNFRGLGIGSGIISEASELFRKRSDDKIIAYVNSRNIASQKAFLKAGYIKISEIVIKNNSYVLFQYIK